MSRWCASCLMLLLAALLASSAFADEGPDRDLLFYLSFNHKTAIADVAGGAPDPLDFDENLEFRIFNGPDGSSAFNLKTGEEKLQYAAAGNVEVQQGTIVMWVQALDYDPGLIRKSDGHLTHKPYITIKFLSGRDWIKLHLYQYYSDDRAMFYWSSSWDKPKDYRLAAAALTTKRRNDWFQLAATWDMEHIRIYRDGVFQTQANIPSELKDKIAAFKMDPARSTIGVREPYFRPDNSDGGTHTAVDEIRIYDRALSELEIKRLYQQVAGDKAGDGPLPDFDMQLDGVDDGGPLDRLRVSADFRALNDDWRSAIDAGDVKAAVNVTDPAGEKRTVAWRPHAMREELMLDQITTPGQYEVDIELTRADGKHVSAGKSIVRPDTSWAGNMIGLADTVPTPWTPMSVDKKQGLVNVWARTYDFTDAAGNIHMFPQQVTHEGHALLTDPPKLEVVTGDGGPAAIAYKLTGFDDSHKSYVVITGTGQAETFTLNWTTRIDFDGLVRCDWTIDGEPAVREMYLDWTVDRAYSDFVLDPLLRVSGNGEYQSLFPYNERKQATVLWMTNENRGFCWVPEHDGNWVYDPDKDKPIQARVDDAGGHARIEMINRPVTIPQGAAYHAMFIATPSRPLMERFRTLAMGGYGRFDQCDYSLVLHSGEGQDGIYSLKPTEHFAEAMKRTEKIKHVLPYAAATGLNNYCAAGVYFNTYWELPNGASGSVTDRFTGETYIATSVTPSRHYADYIMRNLKELYEHPAAGNVGGIYYDLVNNTRCDNPLNGGRFTDAFGRQTSKLLVMDLRAFTLRSLRLSRQFGYITMLHSHSFYNPAIDGFGDIWFPGEQYCAEIQKTGNPYYYTDSISEDVYRSELNMHLKGSAIRFLGNLGRASKAMGTPEQTRAMCTPLLLNDVPIAIAFEDGATINRIWKIQSDYQLDDAIVTYFYDKANPVAVDNEQVKATFYRCPGDRVLLILGNMSPAAQDAQVDISALLTPGSQVTDLWNEQPLEVRDGRIQVSLPQRQFTIIGIDHAARSSQP